VVSCRPPCHSNVASLHFCHMPGLSKSWIWRAPHTSAGTSILWRELHAQNSSPRIGTSAHSTRLHQQRCVGGDGCDARVRVGAWVAVVSLSRCLTLHPKTKMSQCPPSLEDIVDAVARAYGASPVIVEPVAQLLKCNGDSPTPNQCGDYHIRAMDVVNKMTHASTEAESPAHHGSQSQKSEFSFSFFFFSFSSVRV
jgi:hypothetical protein